MASSKLTLDGVRKCTVEAVGINQRRICSPNLQARSFAASDTQIWFAYPEKRKVWEPIQFNCAIALKITVVKFAERQKKDLNDVMLTSNVKTDQTFTWHVLREETFRLAGMLERLDIAHSDDTPLTAFCPVGDLQLLSLWRFAINGIKMRRLPTFKGVTSRLKNWKKNRDAEPEEALTIFKLAEQGEVTAMKEFLSKWEKQEKKRKRKSSKTAAASAKEETIPVKFLNPIANLTRRVKRTTPLMLCAQLGHAELIRNVLLPMCISSINNHDIHGCSALTYAVKHGRTEIAEVLLNYGADPTLEPPSNSTRNAWYWAVHKGYAEIVTLMIERIDVNALVFEDSSPAIIEAAKHGHVEIFTALLCDPHIRINLADANGKTAFDYIQLYNRASLRAKVMPGSRANAPIQDPENPKLESLSDAIKKGNLREVECILEACSADQIVQVHNRPGLDDGGPGGYADRFFAAFKDATLKNDVDIVRLLLTRLELSEAQLRGLLEIAVSSGFVYIINTLMGLPAVTPEIVAWMLHLACKDGRFTIVERILRNSDDLVQSTDMQKCFSLACHHGYYRIVEIILDYHPVDSGYWPGGFIQESFVAAVQKGNSITMKSLILKNFKIRSTYISVQKEASSDKHVTLWEHACREVNVHILQVLLECHEYHDINTIVKPKFGPPLALCVKNANLKGVRLILNSSRPWFSSVDPNIKAEDGLSALHLAIIYDRRGKNYEMVRTLLSHPMLDLNTFRFSEHTSPIQDCKNDEIAAMLLDDGRLDLKIQNNYGITPLIHMCLEGRPNQVEKLLEIDCGPDVVNGSDGEGHTALMKTCFQDRQHVYQQDRIVKWVKCAEILLNCWSLDFEKQDFEGKTAFLHAASTSPHKVQAEDGDVLELLIRFSKEKGVDVGMRSTDHTGNNALMFACFNTNYDTVKTLLDTLPVEEVARLNQHGVSSFDEAVEACATDLVELMLEYGKSHPGGVDVNGRSPMGRTPLNRACAGRYQDLRIIQLLLEHPEFNSINVKREPEMKTALMLVASSNAQGTICGKIVHELLADPNIDVNAQDADGETALMMACGRGYSRSVLDELLRHPDTDANLRSNDGRTAIMIAAVDNCDGALKELLLHAKLDINAKDNEGSNVLHLAAEEGHLIVVQLLVAFARGLDIRALNGEGKTAEDIAREIAQTDRPTKHLAIANYLKKQGAVVGKRIPHYFLDERIVLRKEEKKEEPEQEKEEEEEEKQEEDEVISV